MKLKPELETHNFNSISSSVELLNSKDEGMEEKKKARVCLMTSGWNLNDIFFTKEVIQEVVNATTSRSKIFVNHDPYAWLGRDQLQWAASIRSCKYEETNGIGKAIAEIEFTDNPATEWIYDELKKDPLSVQFSTHIRGFQKEGEYEGRKGFGMTQLAEYKSTDIVPYGAAGGYGIETLNSILEKNPALSSEAVNIIKQIMESRDFTQSINTKGSPMDIKTAADLQAAYPDLLNSVVTAAVAKAMADADVQAKVKSVDVLNSQVNDLNTKMADTDKKLVEALNSLSVVTGERDALKKEVDTLKASDKAAKWALEVETAITNSKISPNAVTDFFKASLMKAETIEAVNAAIEDRKKATEGSAVAGTIINGKPNPDAKKDEHSFKLTDDDIINGIRG